MSSLPPFNVVSHVKHLNPAMISHDAIVIYSADFRDFASDVDELNSILSLSEQQRAERLFFSDDQVNIKVSFALTKIILAEWLCCAAREIVFEYGPHGKPFCLNQHGVNFNISHSQDQFLMAVSREREVGIDIEVIKGSRDVLALSERYFSKNEIAYLNSLPVSEQVKAFYRIWAAKEAFIKLIGKGLAYDLTAFDIQLSTQDEEPRILVRDPMYSASAFQLREYDVFSEYKAALAYDISQERPVNAIHTVRMTKAS